MSNRETVLKILKDRHEKSGGHCGTRLVTFGISFKILKPLINGMYQNGIVTVHDGANGKLIKLIK